MTTNGQFLNRQVNFEAKRRTKIIDVPELGCSVILGELSIADAMQLIHDPAMQKDPARQLALTIVDAEGQRIFTSPEDIANLAKMSNSVATMLIEQAMALNGASAESIEQAKNSSALTADSAGASPVI